MQRYPPHIDSSPANMTRWPNVGLMLGQCRSTTLDQRIVFAGLTHIVAAILNRSDKSSAKSITNVYSPGKCQVPTTFVKYLFLDTVFCTRYCVLLAVFHQWRIYSRY